MKKWIKFIGVVFCLIVSMTIFSACDLLTTQVTQTDSSVTPPVPIKVPSEVRVSGYKTEIEVGENFITKLKVEAKLEGNWEEVVKVDYVAVCSYTGNKYGEYKFNVYLKEFPSVEYSDTIIVNPKKVVIPESYSTVYTGEAVDIKSYYEDLSQDEYQVVNYMNMSNCGEYEVSLRLTNTDKYVWTDVEGNILKNPTQKIKWNITKAPAKTYGNTSIVVYAGDTLYDVLLENNLENITWYKDVNNNNITAETKVDGTITKYYAHYNENPQNYEDTLVTFTVAEFIEESNYTIEYYCYDGSEYVLDESLTEIVAGNIGDIVEITPKVLEGYQLNELESALAGKILKKNGLVLKLYYDIAE